MKQMFNAGIAVDYLKGYFDVISKMGYVKTSFQWRYMLYLFLIDFVQTESAYITEKDYKQIRLAMEQLFSDGGCLFPYPLFCSKKPHVGMPDQRVTD